MAEPSFASAERMKFNSPDEEIAYLRAQLAGKESAMADLSQYEQHDAAVETVRDFADDAPKNAVAESYRMSAPEVARVHEALAPEDHDTRIEELSRLLPEKGVLNTMKVVHALGDPHLEDDFHRFLIQYVKSGGASDAGERTTFGRGLAMTLYEVALPEYRPTNDQQMQRETWKELIARMEQFLAGMSSAAGEGGLLEARSAFTLELANGNHSDEVVFYVGVPDKRRELFEKQIEGIFPTAKIAIQPNDYNIFTEGGAVAAGYAAQAKKTFLPIKTYETFEADPLPIMLNVFSKLKTVGEGAAIQIALVPADVHVRDRYKEALKRARKGEKVRYIPDVGIAESFKEVARGFGSALFGMKTSESSGKDADMTRLILDEELIKHIDTKLNSPLFEVNIRIVASAETSERAQTIYKEIDSAFNQFFDGQGNSLTFRQVTGGNLTDFLQEFSFRTFSNSEETYLNSRELTSLYHFPIATKASDSPQLRQAKSGSGPAPLNVPHEGTRLGFNLHRGNRTEIYMKTEDRMRHMYVIGQTGTGKTNILKNMIVQDIEQGHGVCFIDPHGSDLEEILGVIPESRYEDVIYFDPAHVERPMALNMLEYDPRFPEQKTFVVNELFSIFQKLYGAVPESMGPMFEQYFRNATMLVIEDPQTGNTLLDVSRVMADSQYRALKLSRCKNPIVTQFWQEIASKAGGEGKLENMVPYITSKFDVFLANDFMRPIIAQEHSTFNFRNLMDQGKILLVNLSKGRIGDINANLLGLILVGKILMAALSRVDTPNIKDRRDFFLYIDEFQNVTTDSIATILSEARKYRLSLNVAHQFIAQLDDKIKNAVFGNVGNMALFRVGADDAEYLKRQLEPVFTDQDLIKLDNFNAYIKILIDGQPTRPFNMQTYPFKQADFEQAKLLKELSYETYGRPREEIEIQIAKKYAKR